MEKSFSFIVLVSLLLSSSCSKNANSSSNIVYPKSGAYGVNILDSTTYEYA